MSSEKKGGGQEGAMGKIFERQRMQQAAEDAAKKLEDASKEAEETAREAAQAAHEETQVSLSGSTAAAALSVPCLAVPAALCICIRLSQTV